MSRETFEWLNTNTLIGFTEKRGKAWHAREGYDNHFTGPVPIEAVRSRLFAWKAEEHPLILGHADGDVVVPDGVIPGRKAIVRNDTGDVLGIFGNDYKIHDYEEWLLTNVEHILDDDLQIGTAGLLRNGGQAWVQVEVPETLEFAGGIKARPFLLAATSLDGTLSSTYGRAVTNTVCDNTMAIAMTEHGGARMKFRHSKNSIGRIKDVREALEIVYSAADDFGRQVEALLEQEMTSAKFAKLVEDMVPLPDQKKAPGAYNTAVRKREDIHWLWNADERVAPWQGTAMGAWQAFNTYDQHESKLRSKTVRAERNAGRMVTAQQDKADFLVLDRIMEMAA